MKLRIPYWYLLLGPAFIYYLGGLFNLGVMALNHGQMPVLVTPEVWAYMDQVRQMMNMQPDVRHSLMTSSTHLKFLCDWMNLGDGYASPGDVLVWLSQAISTPCLAWGTLMIKNHNEDKKYGGR